MPKVIPEKIEAQFEQEERFQKEALQNSIKMASMREEIGGAMTFSTGAQGVDRKYESIKSVKQPAFMRDSQKKEAGVNPENNGTLTVAGKKRKHVEPNPYEAQVNSRITKEDTPNGFPKVTFNSRDFYDRAKDLSTKVPIWSSAKENPIYMFVPEGEQPVKTVPEGHFEEQERRTLRSDKLQTLAGRERNLQLAGTMALQQRTMSPESKLR